MHKRIRNIIFSMLIAFFVFNLPFFGVTTVKASEVPIINNIMPERGFSCGGTELIIEGEGLFDISQVYFGNMPVREFTVDQDGRTIRIITRAHWAGNKEISLETSDGNRYPSSLQFTYISTPTIDVLTDLDNNPLDVISTKGGQKLRVKGSGFVDGGKVIFNPVLKKSSNDSEGNEEKVYIYNTADNNISNSTYILESAVEGTAYEFIDSETIVIETPPGELYSKGIMVINPDNGASTVYNEISYSLPELPKPVGLEAKKYGNNDEEYIKLQWEELAEAIEYEIYVIIDNEDLDFVGTSTTNSFVFYEPERDSSYKFFIKAIGTDSYSRFSEMSNSVHTSDDIGPVDEDGSINEYIEKERNGDLATIKIGTRDYDDDLIEVDLRSGKLAACRGVEIIIPAKVICSSRAENIEIQGGDFILSFNPKAFRLDKLEQNRREKDAGVRFKIYPCNGTQAAGRAHSVSASYLLEATAFIGQQKIPVDYLADNMYFLLDYDQSKARMRRIKNIAMYRYDEYLQEWRSSYYWQKSISSGPVPINRLGLYGVMGSR